MADEIPPPKSGKKLGIQALITTGIITGAIGLTAYLNSPIEYQLAVLGASCFITMLAPAYLYLSTVKEMAPEHKANRLRYYKENPENDPKVKRAVKQKARAERVKHKMELDELEEEFRRSIEDTIANDSTLLSYMERLSAAKERNDRKLIHDYKKLINARQKELKEKFNY